MMITLATFTNELEAQLLESQLKSAGVDYRIQRNDPAGVGSSDGVTIQVFEDDLDLAKEIMEARAMDDDDFSFPMDTDADLDDFPDE
jgi:Putative prokaryotic signal transducing protein